MWQKATFEKVLNLTFPNSCAVCGARVSPFELVCDRCKEEIFRSGPEVRPREKRYYTLHVYGKYEGKLRRLILFYKSGRWRLHKILAELFLSMFEYFPPRGVLTYVPASFSSLEHRGFDHMKLIAQAIAKRYPVVVKKLLEVVSDERQLMKSGSERRKNIGRFIASRAPKTVVLIDDVYTTGVTVSDCVRALRSSGAEDIRVYVLAMARV